MRVCIHRGASQVGGICIELECGGHRLLLDVGQSLGTHEHSATNELLLQHLRVDDPAIQGIVLSHSHPDHDGLANQFPPRVPVYEPASSAAVRMAASRFAGGAHRLAPRRPLQDRHARTIGPFLVTPLAVDHSAYESYALLVEADGRRLLYSGDLRAHGRKPGMWKRLIRNPPPDVHALLLEGTTLSRPEGVNVTEQDVEDRLADLSGKTRGMVLAAYSAQNIDRLVSVYRAARRSGRTLVLDLYGAAIAAATGRRTIPQAQWPNVRVFVPRSQRTNLIRRKALEELEHIRHRRIYHDALRARAGELLVTMRTSMLGDLERADCMDGAHAVWSLWPGYLGRDSGRRLTRRLEGQGIPLALMHASGHAAPRDLATLAHAVAPTRLVPIHTDLPLRYERLYERIEVHEDGQWWSL